MYCMGAPIKVVCDDEGVVFSLEFVKRDAVVGLYCSPLDPIMNKERLKMEDAQLWGGGDHWLSLEEHKFMEHIVFLQETTIDFSKAEGGCLKHLYYLPYFIHVVDLEPWK